MTRIAGFLQIYNEVKKGNLRRCLDSMSRYCDVICTYDDASTDNSADVAMSYSKVKLVRGTKNEFGREMYHKQKLLHFAQLFRPDWIFWMDADEVLEKRGEDGALRELAENSDKDAHDFREVNLWRSDRYYRVDNQFNSGIFCRLWRNTGLLTYDPKEGLHHRLYPDGIKTIRTSDLRVIHYGFSSDDRIVDKYRTYKAHGQSGWDLQRIVDESTLVVSPVDRDWFRNEPSGPEFTDLQHMGLVANKL